MVKEINGGIRKQGCSGSREPQVSEREREQGRLARRLAAEGMVLLKNEGLLPFPLLCRWPCSEAGRERRSRGVLVPGM